MQEKVLQRGKNMENNFNIIPMTSEHIEQVMKIQKEDDNILIKNFKLQEELKDANYYYIVAVKETNVLGFASMSILVDHSDISDMFVDKTKRNLGIGTALLKKLIEESKRLKLDNSFLEVSEDNKNAIRLYESVGFKYISKRKGYYTDTNKDALIYSLKLG